ncbi:MAG: hypothetical protein V1487_04210 [bacterium]
MAIRENSPHRVMIDGYTGLQYLAMLRAYAQVIQDDRLMDSLPRVGGNFANRRMAMASIRSLPERENGTHTYNVDVQIDEKSPDKCVIYYHSGTSGELDLLARTASYLESLITSAED